jgi:hypothetical protein
MGTEQQPIPARRWCLATGRQVGGEWRCPSGRLLCCFVRSCRAIDPSETHCAKLTDCRRCMQNHPQGKPARHRKAIPPARVSHSKAGDRSALPNSRSRGVRPCILNTQTGEVSFPLCFPLSLPPSLHCQQLRKDCFLFGPIVSSWRAFH